MSDEVEPHGRPDELVEDLPADADPIPEIVDHPDEVTEEEAAEGQKMYEAIDDLDDESNGLDQ